MNLHRILASFLPVALLVAACSDDETNPHTTGTHAGGSGAGGSGTTTTGGNGGNGGEGAAGGMGGGGSSFVPPAPFAVPLSAAGEDRLMSVTAAADMDFLAAGSAATTLGGTQLVVVTKFSPTGPDVDFGTNGVVTTAVEFVGGNDEIDIVTQSDGKILVSATVANTGIAGDRDIAVLRLNADGTLDDTFGTTGVATVNINDAHDDTASLLGRDGARSLTVDGDDNIFVHAYSRALGDASGGGPRTDTDFTVVKLTPSGVLDTTFADNGVFRLDLDAAEVNATPRGIHALADGSLIASGYANTPDIGTTQAVLYKLTAAGVLDTGFATDGVFYEEVLATQTEIYNFAVHGTNLVTAGYGRNSGDSNDYVSMRFDTGTGVRDLTWGGAALGAVLVDPSGTMLGSNARNAVGLPGGKTVIVGSTGPNNDPAQNAVFVVLDETGALDTDYGTGIHVMALGSDGNDQFWGGAVAGNFVALVGYKGGGATQTDTNNDDAFGLVFEIQ